MNFDRSADSLRLNMGYADKIFQDVQPQQIKYVTSVAGHFCWWRNNFEKLGRGSQGDATRHNIVKGQTCIDSQLTELLIKSILYLFYPTHSVQVDIVSHALFISYRHVRYSFLPKA